MSHFSLDDRWVGGYVAGGVGTEEVLTEREPWGGAREAGGAQCAEREQTLNKYREAIPIYPSERSERGEKKIMIVS